MSSLKGKSKTIPRLEEKPLTGVQSVVVDRPIPGKNECTEKIKSDISAMAVNKCVECTVTKEKSVYDWQRQISAICTNYARKLEQSVKFTVRIIGDNKIGIWRIK